jgi:hypothetical protein
LRFSSRLRAAKRNVACETRFGEAGNTVRFRNSRKDELSLHGNRLKTILGFDTAATTTPWSLHIRQISNLGEDGFLLTVFN